MAELNDLIVNGIAVINGTLDCSSIAKMVEKSDIASGSSTYTTTMTIPTNSSMVFWAVARVNWTSTQVKLGSMLFTMQNSTLNTKEIALGGWISQGVISSIVRNSNGTLTITASNSYGWQLVIYQLL